MHANDRGLLLGDGIFETMKYENNRIQFLQQHLQRIKGSMEALKFTIPANFNDIPNICNELIVKNSLQEQTVALRLTITRGPSKRGISITKSMKPTMLITATSYKSKKNYYPNALISNITKSEHSLLVAHKTTNYLEHILARKEVEDRGYDEAILTNTKNNITESTIANLFFVLNDQLVTPLVSDGILPGIMRATVIACCQKNNIPIVERSISTQEALLSKEIFQTNSLVGIQSFSKINNRILAVGNKAPFATLLNTVLSKI